MLEFTLGVRDGGYRIVAMSGGKFWGWGFVILDTGDGGVGLYREPDV